MNDYQYDVFISYSFKPKLCVEWIHNAFRENFEFYLTQALGRSPAIYFPPASPGENWQAMIKRTLACSRTILPILTVEYFFEDADWCLWEFGTMWKREEKLGYRTESNPGGLIVPILAGDGDHVLGHIGDKIHIADFTPHVHHPESFKKCPDYVIFQKDVRSFVPHVANAITNAPPWDARWLKDNLERFSSFPVFIPQPSM